MARKTKTEKAWDHCFGVTFRKLSHGIQFDMMDLGKLEDCAREAFYEHGDLDSAVASAILRYRKN